MRQTFADRKVETCPAARQTPRRRQAPAADAHPVDRGCAMPGPWSRGPRFFFKWARFQAQPISCPRFDQRGLKPGPAAIPDRLSQPLAARPRRGRWSSKRRRRAATLELSAQQLLDGVARLPATSIHINQQPGRAGADRSVRIVVRIRDPRTPSWLTTAGHEQGTMLFRWVRADSTPVPPPRVVRVRRAGQFSAKGRARSLDAAPIPTSPPPTTAVRTGPARAPL